MRTVLIVFGIIWGTCFLSCKRPIRKPPSQECIRLNNDGTNILTKSAGEKKDVLKAISFYKQAVSCDSVYILAFINLANAYDRIGDYKNEMSIYNHLQTMSNNHISLDFFKAKAEVFEKMNLADSANKLYKTTRAGYIDSLKIHPNNIYAIQGLVEIIALTEGKAAALKELDNRTSLLPELKSDLSSDYYFYQDFDKRAYLYHLTH